MTIRTVIFLILSAILVRADTIRIDHREGSTGNYTPVPLTPVPGYVITFDATGYPIMAAQSGSGGGGSMATDAIWDAAGDLAVGTGANTAARLPKGTALQVLRVNAGATALEWAAPTGGGGGVAAGDSPTWTGVHSFSKAGAASAPTISLTGVPFSGGDATTTKPLLLIEPTGTTSTGWNTTGTLLGVNAPAAFAGNLINAQLGGSGRFIVDINGVVQTRNIVASGNHEIGFSSSPLLSATADTALARMGFGSLRLGRFPSATPAAQTFTIGEASRSSFDSNVGGGTATIRSGLGTGTGAASSLIFQTPTVAAAGSAAQTYATRLTLDASGATFTGPVNMSAGLVTFGPTFTLPTNNDPNTSAEGQISYDANNDVLRGFDGTNQIALGRKIEAIHCTVISPNDLDDSDRDAFWVWENLSGMSFVITGWKGKSDTDDTTLSIVKSTEVGTSIVTVDTVEIALNGVGFFYASDPDGITSPTIAHGDLLYLNFDDTDAPGQVKMTIYGYYDADIN